MRRESSECVLRCLLFEPKLHQIGLERGEGAIERTTECIDRCGGRVGHGTVDRRNEMRQPVLAHVPAPRLQVVSVERRRLESVKITDTLRDVVAVLDNAWRLTSDDIDAALRGD